MSLTVKPDKFTPKNAKTGDEITTPLYGVVAFRTSHIPGKMEATVTFYNSEEEYDQGKLPVPFLMSPVRINFAIPEGKKASLELAEDKVKETLENQGLIVEIN